MDNQLAPLVSIGVPTYNRPAELFDTIRQIKLQTYKNLQVIICDNGGSVSNNVLALIDNDSRFEIVSNSENIGLLRNTEKVLNLARGDYFCWFSDDDWHSPEFIEILLDTLIKNPKNKWVFANFLERIHSGRVRSPLRNNLSRSLVYMTHPNKYFRQIFYYLDDHASGKCNAFYGLFRTEVLRKINFEILSSGYRDYALDAYIVYEMLKLYKAIIIHDPLIVLTADNQKYYRQAASLSLFRKSLSFVHEQIASGKKMFSLTDNTLLRYSLLILCPIKFFSNFASRLYMKIKVSRLQGTENWKAYTQLFESSGGTKDKLKLSDVSLISVATKNVERSILALKYSQKDILFEKTILFSHYTPQLNDTISHIKINSFLSVEEWGEFVIYQLHKYIDTKYILLIHDDGFVVNPDSWNPRFLEYDYIGAPWPLPNDDFSYRTDSGELVRIGNSVSLRSKRILELPSELALPWVPFHGYLHEDGFLNVQYRDILVDQGMKFAPLHLGKSFGREYVNSSNVPFTFHKWLGANKSFPNFSDFE